MITTHALLLIFVAALATFATRSVPFLFLSCHAAHPLILHMGRYLPAIVMMVLIIVALSAMQLPALESDNRMLAWQHWLLSAKGAGMLVSSACVAALHLWRRNALLSIASGTGLYMTWMHWGVTG